MNNEILTAVVVTPLTILVIYLLVEHVESRPRRKARREAAFAYEKLLNEIRFCSHIAYIDEFNDKVLEYYSTWKALIDYETLDQFTGSLYTATADKARQLQSERMRRYNGKSIYN